MSNVPPTVTPSVEVHKEAPKEVRAASADDIRAIIKKSLKEDFEMNDVEIDKIEHITSTQVGEQRFVVGGKFPGSDNFEVFAIYNGEDNEELSGDFKGDVRVYLLPLTVVAPGDHAYRRYTININPMGGKSAMEIIEKMSFDRFVEAVTTEEATVADRAGGLDEPDEARPEEKK